MLKKSKKGITPVIAVILLLMMTVAAAGAAFFWFIRIQSEMQGGAESYSEQLNEKLAAKVEVLTAKYVSGDMHIYLQNQGNVVVPLSTVSTNPTTTWILFDANNNIVCSSTWASGGYAACTSGCTSSLDIGEVQKVVLDLSDDCSNIGSSTYSNDTMFSFVIDFSGLTATGAHFTK